ncbi:hypothetical protein KFL_001510080 [Klebsormidium nitens]|uniref:Uncharacterized protein n=1 Tax=Klebsormidium nitens TaxID=105231 RepID=A0A1Y1HXY1_KLENI|nr:hypothetical protein KFL_001510080 [Klebsormidium nitens]|eukprot:GAQ83505.1 hypothetical protein KFL_001510080 [Klebsormidium nitens]
MDEDECTSLSSGDEFYASTGGSQEGPELIGPQEAVESERPAPGDQDLDSPQESESSGGNSSSSAQDWWPQSSAGSGQAGSEESGEHSPGHKENSLPKKKPMRLIGEGDGVEGPPDATLPILSRNYWLNILYIIPEQLAEALENKKSKTEILDVQIGVLAWIPSLEVWKQLSSSGESVVMESFLLDEDTLKSGDKAHLPG